MAILSRPRYNHIMHSDTPVLARKKVLLIDSFALLFRAYAALPPLVFKDRQVGAMYGFLSILLRFLDQERPAHVIAAYDRPEMTFREEKHDGYKAQREPAPQDFYDQVADTMHVLNLLHIPAISSAGFEADDVLGTLARAYESEYDVVILTSDKDMLQLLSPHISVLTPKVGFGEDTRYSPEFFLEKYGFPHEHWVEYKALRGDPSDNLPGAKGIGEKTATHLVQTFGTVTDIYTAVHAGDERIKPRIVELLRVAEDEVRLTRELVEIRVDVPVSVDLKHAVFPGYTQDEAREIIAEYGFRQLENRLVKFLETKSDTVEVVVSPKQDVVGEWQELSEDRWKTVFKEWKKAVAFAFIPQQGDSGELEKLGISWTQGSGYWFSKKTFVDKFEEIAERFANPKVKKITHDAKDAVRVLRRAGVSFEGEVDDVLLMAYVLRSDALGFGLANLAATKLGIMLADDMAMAADVILRLGFSLQEALQTEDTWKVYEQFERPLVPVLRDMEDVGIRVDIDWLAELDKRYDAETVALRNEIQRLAGVAFNIDSPKQLREVLFNDLGLSIAGIRKTKTGISTAADTLEKLRGAHPIIELIERYREITKLLSTYVKPLASLTDGDDRVHTIFNQAVTATGRLSSSEPNLQNIPIRTEQGKNLRRAFVAANDWDLVSIDYSQIELRVAAALAGEEQMIEAFKRGDDIHTWTASRIHDIPHHLVTKDIRRTAKEINFGVLYGMGAFGVSERTGLSRDEAARFIETYFNLFPKLHAFLDELIVIAAKKGYAETKFGRRRYLPDLQAPTRTLRAMAERMAVNMPMQGTAADIMKAAMIQVYDYLQKKDPYRTQCRLVLQVHDELLFEVKKDSIAKYVPELMKCMRNAIDFPVPLEVDAKIGSQWGVMYDYAG